MCKNVAQIIFFCGVMESKWFLPLSILGGISFVAIVRFFYLRARRNSQIQFSSDLKEYAAKLKKVPLIYDSPTLVVEPWSFCQDSKRWKQFRPKKRDNSHYPTDLSIITYNIWFSSHRQKERTDALVQILREKKADVICLQEVTSSSMDIINKYEFIRENYICTDIECTTMQGYGVVLFISKQIINDSSFVNIYFRNLPSSFCRRVVFCDLHYTQDNGKDKILRISSVHLESSKGAHKIRADQLKIIFSMIKNEKDVRLYDVVKANDNVIKSSNSNIQSFFVGDFNFDYDWLKKQPNNSCGELDVIEMAGFSDSWKVLHGDDPGFTMPSSNGRPPRRIDYVLYNSSLFYPEILSILGTDDISQNECEICNSNERVCSPSDHFGIYSFFKTKS